MTVRFPGALAAVVLLTAVVASGCARPNTHPDTGVETADGLALLKETEMFTGDEGGFGLGGYLSVVAGKCLGFAFNGDDTLILFPPDATLSADSKGKIAVKVGGMKLHLGEKFEAGARQHPGHLSAFGDLADQAPAACRHLPAMPVDEFGPVPAG